MKTMNGMLRHSPNASSARLPCDAPPTASMLSSDIVMSARTITFTASQVVVAARSGVPSSSP